MPEVDAAVDAVGFEARGHGADAERGAGDGAQLAHELTRAAGKLGIPGLYVTGDPGGVDENAKEGSLSIRDRPGLGEVAQRSSPASAR